VRLASHGHNCLASSLSLSLSTTKMPLRSLSSPPMLAFGQRRHHSWIRAGSRVDLFCQSQISGALPICLPTCGPLARPQAQSPFASGQQTGWRKKPFAAQWSAHSTFEASSAGGNLYRLLSSPSESQYAGNSTSIGCRGDVSSAVIPAP
jgi:hypothetical protein